MAKISDKTEEGKKPEEEKMSEKIIKKWFPEKPAIEVPEKKKEVLERKELTKEEKAAREQLIEEIKKTKPSPQVDEEVKKEAEKMKILTVKGKIKHLLDLAQAKSLSYSVEVAKGLKDPYLLDIFHDILAKEGLYKKFLK